RPRLTGRVVRQTLLRLPRRRAGDAQTPARPGGRLAQHGHRARRRGNPEGGARRPFRRAPRPRRTARAAAERPPPPPHLWARCHAGGGSGGGRAGPEAADEATGCQTEQAAEKPARLAGGTGTRRFFLRRRRRADAPRTAALTPRVEPRLAKVGGEEVGPPLQ